MPETRPPVAMSSVSTALNQTGSWKYIRPEYRDRVAPCNQGCPIGIDIEGYMTLLRAGDVDGAVDLLLRENPMPAVTGRICNHPCETACNRGRFDGAVAVHSVERMLGDVALERRLEPVAAVSREERVAVVGSGPAGLSCAYQLARLGYDVTVFEAAAAAGGMLRLGIPAYRLPREVLDRQIAQLQELGIRFVTGAWLGGEQPWDTLSAFDAVFLATGAHEPRSLGVEGESHPRVQQGLAFLKAVNGGDAPEVGRRVMVVGGGNTAMDCARTALRLGAQVSVVYRRTRAEMPAIEEEIVDAEREGVRFIFLASPVSFRGPGTGPVEVTCARMELGEPDASGRRRPVETAERLVLEADTVLLATGELASVDSLPAGVRASDGAIVVDALGAASEGAVFAGGDVTDAERTVAHAMGAGKRAAIGIDRRLRQARGEAAAAEVDALRLGRLGNVSMTRWLGDDPVKRVNAVNEAITFDDINLAHFAARPRNEDRKRGATGARDGFREVNLGLDRQTALSEAGRCFQCGVCNECEVCMIYCGDVAIRPGTNGARFDVDLDHCKGCGVCAEECPRGAITMTREGL